MLPLYCHAVARQQPRTIYLYISRMNAALKKLLECRKIYFPALQELFYVDLKFKKEITIFFSYTKRGEKWNLKEMSKAITKNTC